MDKNYYIQYGIGKSKYCIFYYNGIKKHIDGSIFYDIKICNSKKDMNEFIKTLITLGYKER